MNTIVGEWVGVDGSINTPFTKELGGVRVRMTVAPQNVPVAVRALDDAERKAVVVEFKYYGTEEKEAQRFDGGVIAGIGTSTGRVHRISIPKSLFKGTNHLHLIVQVAGGTQKTVTNTYAKEMLAALEKTLFETLKSLKEVCDYDANNVSEEYFELTRRLLQQKLGDLFAVSK